LFFKRSAPKPSASQELMQAIRAKYNLSDEDGLSISEIACSHPECGDAETAILIFKKGEKTRAVKILKSLSKVDLTDLDLIVEG
jgi:transcriptional regulator of NAD metabolism